MKKCLTIGFLVAVLCLGILLGAGFGNANSADAKNDSFGFYENANRSVDIYKKVMPFYKNADDSYTSDFGGVYIDSEGYLTIGVVASELRIKDLRSKSSYDGQVKYVRQTYSYTYLQTIQDAVGDIMLDYDIYLVETDETTNRVEIYVKDEKSINKTIEYLRRKGFDKETAWDITVDKSKEAVLNANTVYGGDRLATQSLGAPSFAGTVCVNAYDTQTGQYGILTNKHVADLGTMYVNGWFAPKIGSATKSQRSGTIDAAFVPFANQNNFNITSYSTHSAITYTNIKLGTEQIIIKGAPTRRIGQTTGITTGKIENANATVTSGGVILKGIIKYSNAGKGGDSGGPVYCDYDGREQYLIGMHYSSTPEDSGLPESERFGFACRITEVMRLFNITPVTSECNGMYITANIGSSEIQIIGNNFIPSDGIISVPESINGRKVVQFNEYAFAHHPELKKVYIPTTVRAIAATAFANSNNVVLRFPNGYKLHKNGMIYVVAGGYAFYVSDWNNLPQSSWGSYVNVTQAQMNLTPQDAPDDGTLVHNIAGKVYRYAGGAAFYVHNWANIGGIQPYTSIDGNAINFSVKPKDGTFVETLNGTAYVYAGKAPIKINSWDNMDRWHPATLVDGLSMILTDKPINDTFVTTKAGKIFRFTNGKAVRINSWADVGGVKPSVLVDETVIVTYM